MGSNLAEGDVFLREIKDRSTPSFRGEVKLSTPCRKIFYGMLKITAKNDRNNMVTKFKNFTPTPCFYTRCLFFIQRTLVDESRVIRTQMVTHNTSEKWPQCMGRFVRYHPVTVTSRSYILDLHRSIVLAPRSLLSICALSEWKFKFYTHWWSLSLLWNSVWISL
jgi:hypothetical protein